MNRIVRFFASVAMLATVAISQSGCLSNLTRPAIDREFNGTIFNVGQYNGEIRLINPPKQYSEGSKLDNNYSLWRPFEAQEGATSYWLTQRVRGGREPGYDFEVRGASGTIIGKFTVWVNGIQDDAAYDGRYSALDFWYEWPTGRSALSAQPSRGDQ